MHIGGAGIRGCLRVKLESNYITFRDIQHSPSSFDFIVYASLDQNRFLDLLLFSPAKISLSQRT